MRIVAFYRNEQPDSEGRFLDDILRWDDRELEYVHDYIQWLFPLTAPSQFNPDAPLLDDAEIEAFQNDPLLREKLRQSLRLMLSFYGFELIEGNTVKVRRGHNWNERKDNWLRPGNHNLLRITRLLKSLCLLGLREHARAFFAALSELYRGGFSEIIGTSHSFWRAAAS